MIHQEVDQPSPQGPRSADLGGAAASERIARSMSAQTPGLAPQSHHRHGPSRPSAAGTQHDMAVLPGRAEGALQFCHHASIRSRRYPEHEVEALGSCVQESQYQRPNATRIQTTTDAARARAKPRPKRSDSPVGHASASASPCRARLSSSGEAARRFAVSLAARRPALPAAHPGRASLVRPETPHPAARPGLSAAGPTTRGFRNLKMVTTGGPVSETMLGDTRNCRRRA
jgi:hypothetical protein